ncbi:hypothetical protein GJ496_004812 [Pomphorhynchus laevis]|nr:hypothetical protein GJ496_004812 [Pomphorhynchus laevis]
MTIGETGRWLRLRNRVLNPHNMMAKVLEKYVFGTSGNSVVVLAKTLNRTIMPAFSIQDIPSNLRGPAFTLTENIRGTFLINFETPLHWIISWGSQIFLKLDFSLDNNAIQISDMTQSICELLKTELNCLSLFEMAKTYLLSWTGYGLNPQPSVVNSMNPISMQTSQDTRITQEYEMRPRSVHPGYYVNTGQLFSQQIYPQAALQSSPRLMQDQSRFQSHRLPSPFSNTSHQQQMTNQALVGENFPKRAFDEGSSIPTSPAVAPDSKPRSNIGIRQTPTQGPWWFTDFIPNVSAIDSVKSKMPMPADHLPPFFISTKTLFIFFTSYGIKYRTQNVLINRLFSSIHLVNKMTALFKLYAAKGLINSRLAISNDREILVYRCTKVPLDFTFVFDPHLPGFLVHLMQNNESSPSIFNFDELQSSKCCCIIYKLAIDLASKRN